ncbi:MAG: uroporphyrinogen-III C-methyltransferase [Halothiobacillus sp.]
MTQSTSSDSPVAHDRTETDPLTIDQAAEKTAAEDRPIPLSRVYAYWLLTLFVVFSGSLVSLSWIGWKLFQTNAERIDQVLTTQRAEQNNLSQALSAAQRELIHAQTQIKTERGEITQLRSENQAGQQALTAQIGQVEQKLAGIQDRLGRGETAWQLADIGFLLTRAQERLSIAHDPEGAAVALRLADERLAALALPQLLPVRAAISDALTGLDTVAALDRVGMALALRRTAEQVTLWPLAGSEPNNQTSATEPATTSTNTPSNTLATGAPWYIRWPRAAWQPIADWFTRQFTLTRSDEPFKASARTATDHETLLWLTAVREALLARDTPMLRASLTQAQHWILGHYATQAPDLHAVLNDLTKTQEFTTTAHWPSLAPIFKAWQAAGLTPAPGSPIPSEVQP